MYGLRAWLLDEGDMQLKEVQHNLIGIACGKGKSLHHKEHDSVKGALPWRRGRPGTNVQGRAARLVQ
eukprot:scaffold273571_cov18-Tisochrysis_lutea.AAC.1